MLVVIFFPLRVRLCQCYLGNMDDNIIVVYPEGARYNDTGCIVICGAAICLLNLV